MGWVNDARLCLEHRPFLMMYGIRIPVITFENAIVSDHFFLGACLAVMLDE